jgi:hypothetical protein
MLLELVDPNPPQRKRGRLPLVRQVHRRRRGTIEWRILSDDGDLAAPVDARDLILRVDGCVQPAQPIEGAGGGSLQTGVRYEESERHSSPVLVDADAEDLATIRVADVQVPVGSVEGNAVRAPRETHQRALGVTQEA